MCRVETASNGSGTSKSDVETTYSKILDSILSLRKDMCAQFRTINENVSGVKTQILVVNNTIEGLRSALEFLKRENEERKAEYSRAIEENGKIKKELSILKDQISDLQQYSRRNNIELVGVPQTEGEDVYYLLQSVARCIGVNYRREDISVAHRLPAPKRELGRSSGYPTILISFVSRTAKETWKAATKGKQLTAAELSDTFPASRIFLNDHLTPFNKMVLGKSRRYVRERKLHSAWTADCKILVKREAASRATRVWTAEDVDRVVGVGL